MWNSLGTVRNRRLTASAAYLLILVVLIAGSHSRRVGDGAEYLEMASEILHSVAPSPSVHFWLYSALAVPFLAVVKLTSLGAFWAFVPVNVAFLGGAFWFASSVLTWPILALVFLSPIIWWVDKAHTEVFTFSLLTIALIALRRPGPAMPRLHPGWAVVCLAVAGTQNPPFLLLAPVAAAALLITKQARIDDRTFVALCSVAGAIASLHPAYYYFTSGKLSGLAGATHGQIPNLGELTAVIADTNLGLIPNAPVFALAGALALAAVFLRSPRRILELDALFALGAGAIFLLSFSQTSNYNHGGTPGMSRYGLWLIPLAVPFFGRVREVLAPRVDRVMIGLAVFSCAWSVAAFHPARHRSETPSVLAQWLWMHHPSIDRPLPEVFVERIRGTEGDWRLPAAHPDCTKILLVGHGHSNAMWPFPCFPVDVPPQCRERNALCYANRQGVHYEFSKVPKPSHWGYRFDKRLVWTHDQGHTARALLTRLRWWEMSLCHVSVRRVERGAFGVGGPPYYCGSDRLLAFFGSSGGAEITLRLRTPMSGAFIDGTTGQVVRPIAYDQAPGELWTLSIPEGPSSIFLMLATVGPAR